MRLSILATAICFSIVALNSIVAFAENSTLNSQDNSKAPSAGLEEIVVTAQKRSEKLMDVSGSITAIGGDRLESLGVNSLSDLAGYVPGLTVTDGGAPGSRLIEVRGIGSGYQPTSGALVGTYIDDLPIGDSTNGARGALFGLDLNPYDLQGVEVLKGPQGTLYGANSMGGLVKYSLRSPDLERLQVAVGTDVGYIDGSAAPTWSVRGATSLPIIDNLLALRISGFDKHNAGYIDNISTGAKDDNHSVENGGRATILWKPAEALALRATVLYQDVNAASMTAVSVNANTRLPIEGADNYKLSSAFSQPFNQQSRIYSFAMDWNLDFATLTNSTGWSRVTASLNQDLTAPFGSFCAPNALGPGSSPEPGCPGYPSASALVGDLLGLQVSKFVEEIRLASPENQRVNWMLGGFFTKESSGSSQYLPPYTLEHVPILPIDFIYGTVGSGTYREPAVFANLTYKFNERFDIGGGERYSWYSIIGCTDSATGLFGAGGTLGCSRLPSTGVSVWMTNARFHLTSESMLYARIATGYRPGGGCPTCGNSSLGVPGIVNPDKTKNYEIGFKGTFLEHRLQLEASLFRINWDDIQLTTTNGKEQYPGNGGTAKSDGLEFTAAYEIATGLRLDFTGAFTNARLTQDAPAAFGASGDELPGAARFTTSLGLDYDRPLSGGATVLIGGDYRYKDGVVNQFEHTPSALGGPVPMGPQNIVDLYSGFSLRNLTTRLYAKNLFNNRSYAGLLYIADPTKPQYVPIQPRTIGVSIDYQY